MLIKGKTKYHYNIIRLPKVLNLAKPVIKEFCVPRKINNKRTVKRFGNRKFK